MPPSRAAPRARVAVIGSGLAGLACAHRLAPTCDVHVIEAAPALGLDSASIVVRQPTPPTASDTLAAPPARPAVRVDVPMRSLNYGYYPETCALYTQLGLTLRPTEFTYSFATSSPPSLPAGDAPSDDSAPPSSTASMTDDADAPRSVPARTPRRAPAPHTLYNGASGLRGVGLPSMHRWQAAEQRVQARSASRGLPRPVRLAATLLCLVLGVGHYALWWAGLAWSYLLLIPYVLYHHHTGHLRDPSHHLAQTSVATWLGTAPVERKLPSTRPPPPRWGYGRLLTRTFAEQMLLPLMSAVMTCPLSEAGEAPVADVLEYVAATFLRAHARVQGGVARVQSALIQRIPKAHLHVSARVVGLAPTEEGTVQLLLAPSDGGAPGSLSPAWAVFDHVVLATPADLGGELLERYLHSHLDKGGEEHSGLRRLFVQALTSVPYTPVTVVNHTDRHLLPPCPADWRDLNLVLPSFGGQTMATHVLAKDFPSANGPQVLLQTTAPQERTGLTPRPATILSTATMRRARSTLASRRIQGDALFRWAPRMQRRRAHLLSLAGIGRWDLTLGAAQGVPLVEHGSQARIWACGSWSPGIPLLEGCVRSARLVADAIIALEEA